MTLLYGDDENSHAHLFCKSRKQALSETFAPSFEHSPYFLISLKSGFLALLLWCHLFRSSHLSPSIHPSLPLPSSLCTLLTTSFLHSSLLPDRLGIILPLITPPRPPPLPCPSLYAPLVSSTTIDELRKSSASPVASQPVNFLSPPSPPPRALPIIPL